MYNQFVFHECIVSVLPKEFLCALFIASRYKKEIYELVKKRTEEADNVNEVNNHLICIHENVMLVGYLLTVDYC